MGGGGIVLRFNDYVEEGSSPYKVLGYGLFAVLIIIMVWFYYFKSRKGKSDRYDNYLMYIIPTLLIMVSFISLSSQCYRFFRNMLLISYIVLINIGISKEKHMIRFNDLQLLISLGVLFISIFLFDHQLGIDANHYETITRAIWDNNILFDYFMNLR